MTIDHQLENGKIAIAIRTARAAAGWSQDEFAHKVGVAKSTVARIETLEMSAKADLVVKAMRLFRNAGIEVDLYGSGELSVRIADKSIEQSIVALKDQSQRRSDLKRQSGALSQSKGGSMVG